MPACCQQEEYIPEEGCKRLLQGILLEAISDIVKYKEVERGKLRYKDPRGQLDKLRPAYLSAKRWFLSDRTDVFSYRNVRAVLRLPYTGEELLKICEEISWKKFLKIKGLDKLSPKEQKKLFEMVQEGKSIHEIAKKLHRSWGIVRKYVEKMKSSISPLSILLVFNLSIFV